MRDVGVTLPGRASSNAAAELGQLCGHCRCCVTSRAMWPSHDLSFDVSDYGRRGIQTSRSALCRTPKPVGFVGREVLSAGGSRTRVQPPEDARKAAERQGIRRLPQPEVTSFAAAVGCMGAI